MRSQSLNGSWADARSWMEMYTLLDSQRDRIVSIGMVVIIVVAAFGLAVEHGQR